MVCGGSTSSTDNTGRFFPHWGKVLMVMKGSAAIGVGTRLLMCVYGRVSILMLVQRAFCYHLMQRALVNKGVRMTDPFKNDSLDQNLFCLDH